MSQQDGNQLLLFNTWTVSECATCQCYRSLFSRKGSNFWRTKRDGSLVSLNPAQITNFWMGLPPEVRVDAVYERKSDSRIIFFTGERKVAFFVVKVYEP